MRSVQEVLRHPDLSVAAWQDVVKAFTDPASSAADCLLRLRFLRELCEVRGHRWASLGLAHNVGEILRSSDEEEPSIDARLTACEELIASEPQRADCAIWMVVANAALEDAYLRLGPVQFFERSLLPQAAAEGGWLHEKDEFEALPELGDWAEVEPWLEVLPDEHVVLVRVWIPSTSVSQAPGRAWEVVQSLIEVARPNSAWILFEGHQIWHGSGFSGTSFEDPTVIKPDTGVFHPVFEGTHEALQGFESDFVEKFVAGDPDVAEAIEDARWTVGVERASTLEQRIALGTRALERTLALVQSKDERWSDTARRFLRDAWVDFELRGTLFDTALGFSRRFPERHSANAQAYQEAYDLIAPRVGPSRREYSIRGTAQAWGRYKQFWEEKALAARAMAEVDNILNSPRAGFRALARLEKRFDLLLARVERQRNAVIHGTRTSRGVLASVDHFVATLNRFMAAESLRTSELGTPPLSRYEQARIDALTQRQRLHDGDRLADCIPSSR